MTKRRMIHDCIWQSESVASLNYRARLLWIGLITTADDQGRGRAHPGLIRAAVFPFDIITQEEIESDLQAIVDADMVLVYQVGGKAYYQVAGWWDYQTPQWAGPSDFPSPDGWNDRMRYHGKGRQIVAQNWPNTADTGTPNKASGLPNKLALSPARAGEEEEEEVKEEDKLHGADAPSEQGAKQRKPSEHDAVRGELEAHFSKITHIPTPKTETASQRRAAGSLWWGPIREIAELCEWDLPRAAGLIDATVAHLRGSCTIANPKSILKTAKAASTGNVPGLTLPRDKPKTRIIIIDGEQREVIA